MAQSRRGCGCALAVLGVILAAAVVVGIKFGLPWWQKKPPPPSGKEMQVHILDVWQGDAILIISPENKIALIDAGDASKGKDVLAALKRSNVDHIDYFIATHPHPDHIGGAAEVLAGVKVSTVIDNGLTAPGTEPVDASNESSIDKLARTDPSKLGGKGQQPANKKQGRTGELPTTKAFNDYKNAVTQSGAQYVKAEPDQKYDLGGGAMLTILAPVPPPFTAEQTRAGGNEPNANSVVVRLDYGEFSMLLTGDAETQTEQRLLSKDANLTAKVLKVAHHGSKYATSDEFLKRVKPEAAIISVGEPVGMRYGHPSKPTLERLKAAGVGKLYRTDMQGEITITTNGKEYKIASERETKGDLWAGRDSTKDDSTRSGFVTYGDFGPPPKPPKQPKEKGTKK